MTVRIKCDLRAASFGKQKFVLVKTVDGDPSSHLSLCLNSVWAMSTKMAYGNVHSETLRWTMIFLFEWYHISGATMGLRLRLVR